jgi:hypothetical protein
MSATYEEVTIMLNEIAEAQKYLKTVWDELSATQRAKIQFEIKEHLALVRSIRGHHLELVK